MTAKKRKPLDDALAREFVYGESALRESLPNQEIVDLDTQNQTQPTLEQEPVPQSKLPVSPIPPVSTPQPAKFNLMSQLQQTNHPKEPTIRLTVDLPESMHRKLSVLAAKTSKKKVEIIRFLLDEALKDVEE
jgi:hypothetical protein